MEPAIFNRAAATAPQPQQQRHPFFDLCDLVELMAREIAELRARVTELESARSS